MSDTIESTVMAEPEASSSSAILTGMKRGFPIFLGYVPLGFAYGVLAVQNNIPAVYAVLFSLLVYAGAGQFIAVGLWGMGASVFSIVFTTFVINLRHVLMSAAVAPWFAPFTRFQQFIIGWGLTDEVFAMHSMAMATGEKARLPLVYAANFTSHSGWVLGTFIGAVAGDFLPDPKLFGLDYALPAMFLALLVPQCKERLYTPAAVLSALLSVILAMYDTGRWNVIIASVITSTIRGPARHPPRPQHRRTQEESMNIDLLLCILGMALVTLIPRVMPVTLLAGRELPPLLTRWLSFVPVSVLAALVAPDLLLADGKLNITGDNLFLIATFPTLLICWYKKGSLFGALAVGMGTVALIRYWMA